MHRDTRKTAEYFGAYIVYQIGRIEKFEGVLRNLNKENMAQRLQCHMFLANFYQDLLLAEYSSGSSIDLLKRVYTKYLSHIGPQNALTYDTAVNALSWAVLLDVKDRVALDSIHYPQDGMLDAFYHYLVGDSSPNDAGALSIASSASEPFVQSLTGKMSPEDLNRYIKNDWYRNNRDTSWYESDKRDTNTYCGYWCLAGAAVVKIMQWDPFVFANTAYFPTDLLL